MTTLLAEDFSGEGFYRRAFFPRIRRQSRFAAGLLEKSCAVPGALDGHLGQQQAAASVPADEETVTADFDFFGPNWFSRRQNAQLNFKMRSFFLGDGRESVIVKSGGARGFGHSPEDRAGGQYVADASPQFFFALIFSG